MTHKSFNYSFKRSGCYTDRHELFSGSSKRKISIKYNLFIYLPHDLHLTEVQPHHKKYAEMFCNDQILSFELLNRIMNTNTCLLTEEELDYVNMVKGYMQDKQNDRD